MTITTTDVQVPGTPPPASSHAPTRSTRAIVVWAAVLAVVGAAGLLMISVLDSDSTGATIDSGQSLAEHGSINAVEHRDESALGRNAAAPSLAEHGSITAIEHHAESVSREAPARIVAQHESITAIEHRAEASEPPR